VSDDVQFYVMIQSGPDSSGASSAVLTSVAKALVRRIGPVLSTAPIGPGALVARRFGG
jgi:hypothetical protein